jgi:hypothetical protein
MTITTLVHVHLCGGKADPGRLVHRLGHVTGQTANAVVHLLDACGKFLQAWDRESEVSVVET